MPGVVRLGDALIPHDCFGGHNICSGSGNVFTNSIPTDRVGDCASVHCNCTPVCHGSVQASGSPNVFVNSSPVGRCGDSIACGSTNGACSGNVFAN